MMTFSESIKRCLGKKYSTTRGRAPKSEFWWFFLYFIGGGMILLSILIIIAKTGSAKYSISFIPSTLFFIFIIFNFFPLFSVASRRLHDSGLSSLHLLWGLIPFIGLIILIVLLTNYSMPTANKFGSPYPYDEQDTVLSAEEYAKLKSELSQAWLWKNGVAYPFFHLKYIPDEHLAVIEEWKNNSNSSLGDQRNNFEDKNNCPKTKTKENIHIEKVTCPYCGSVAKVADAEFCWKCGKLINK